MWAWTNRYRKGQCGWVAAHLPLSSRLPQLSYREGEEEEEEGVASLLCALSFFFLCFLCFFFFFFFSFLLFLWLSELQGASAESKRRGAVLVGEGCTATQSSPAESARTPAPYPWLLQAEDNPRTPYPQAGAPLGARAPTLDPTLPPLPSELLCRTLNPL